MPLLDGRGRLFGKINLIDAAVALFVIVLVPLGYAAYTLFRTPAPHVTAIKPSSFKTTKGEHVVLEGEHLRPFLRAFAGTKEVEYLFESPDKAQVALPELPTGTYDLTLFDESHPVAKAGTITVAPPPATPKVLLTIVGTFNGLEPAQAPALRAGIRDRLRRSDKVQPAEWMEVLGVQPPRPAIALLSDAALSGIELPNRVQVVAAVRLQATLAGKDDVTFRDTKIAVGRGTFGAVRWRGHRRRGQGCRRPADVHRSTRIPGADDTGGRARPLYSSSQNVVSSIKREQSAKLPSAFESLTPRVRLDRQRSRSPWRDQGRSRRGADQRG